MLLCYNYTKRSTYCFFKPTSNFDEPAPNQQKINQLYGASIYLLLRWPLFNTLMILFGVLGTTWRIVISDYSVSVLSQHKVRRRGHLNFNNGNQFRGVHKRLYYNMHWAYKLSWCCTFLNFILCINDCVQRRKFLCHLEIESIFIDLSIYYKKI